MNDFPLTGVNHLVMLKYHKYVINILISFFRFLFVFKWLLNFQSCKRVAIAIGHKAFSRLDNDNQKLE